MRSYGERHLRAIVGAGVERIDAAVVDPDGWRDFTDLLAEAFPGSKVSWLAQSPGKGPIRPVASGWSAAALADYDAHYGAINPFLPFWGTLVPQRAVVAGRSGPAIGAAANTEFVTDWLDPQGDLRGAAGMWVGRTGGARAGAAGDEVVSILSAHYPSHRARNYDTGFEFVLHSLSERIGIVQASMASAVRMGERAADRAAIAERAPNAAFVVRADGSVRERCALAGAMVEDGTLVTARVRPAAGECLAFRDPGTNEWFAARVASVCAGDARDADRTFLVADGPVRVRVLRLPGATGGSGGRGVRHRARARARERAPDLARCACGRRAPRGRAPPDAGRDGAVRGAPARSGSRRLRCRDRQGGGDAAPPGQECVPQDRHRATGRAGGADGGVALRASCHAALAWGSNRP